MHSRPSSRDGVVFLDKDGTLVDDVPFNVDPDRILLAEGAREGLLLLHGAGFRIAVASNQSGVARGYFAESALAAVERRLQELCNEIGVPLAGFFYCPHFPAGAVARYATVCECRKPAPGLLQCGMQTLGARQAECWMVGDILDDVEAGNRAGCNTVLINNGNETEWIDGPYRVPMFCVRDLDGAARVITNYGRMRERAWTETTCDTGDRQ